MTLQLPIECAVSRRRFFILLAGACSALRSQSSPLYGATVDPVTYVLSGRVTNASGKHAVYVALWNVQGFLEKPVREIHIDPPAEPFFRFQVPPGGWALSAFEDMNGNGKLDMGVFGPKEPSGFWHPFHSWHKPHFDEVAVQVDHDTSGIEIILNK